MLLSLDFPVWGRFFHVIYSSSALAYMAQVLFSIFSYCPFSFLVELIGEEQLGKFLTKSSYFLKRSWVQQVFDKDVILVIQLCSN